jgi:hypothetical protein
MVKDSANKEAHSEPKTVKPNASENTWEQTGNGAEFVHGVHCPFTQIRTGLVRRARGCIKITPRKSWFSVGGKQEPSLLHKNLSICVQHARSPDRVKKHSVCQVFLNLWLTR